MIGEALALTALYCRNRAVSVVVPKRGTIVIAEIKFRQIAMQMLFAAMLIDTTHAALENCEIALDGICRYVAACVFLLGVIDGFVRRELLANLLVQLAFIGMEAALTINVAANNIDHDISMSAWDAK